MSADGKVVLRVGASLKDALYVVVTGPDATATSSMQSNATRFDTFDDAREVVRIMLARGDAWAERVRPSRLVGTRTIKRVRQP